MRALVCGAGGFIGHQLVSRLKTEGFYVHGADLKKPEFSQTRADEFSLIDLRDFSSVKRLIRQGFQEVYQLAADMGGAGFLFTGDNDADVMRNSVTINANVLRACTEANGPKLFFSSSACIYPRGNQVDPHRPVCTENSAYPAEPDSEYGWEKLFAERLYLAHARNYGLEVRIARFHNIFGPECTWTGGREKAVAALCRKVAEATTPDEIVIWGDGLQTRSFLIVDECIEGVRRLMRSSVAVPINIGSDEMISIGDLACMIIAKSGKKLIIRNKEGPQGVRGRTSDNRLIQEALDWKPSQPLSVGLERTYAWVAEQVSKSQNCASRSARAAHPAE